MAGTQTHTGGLVGAVDHVRGPAEVEREAAERIVRARSDHRLELFAALLAMFLDDGRRRPPGRVLLPAHDLGRALGRLPAHLADADGIGVHDLRLALLHLRVIEESHRGGVDDDALARRVGQDELRRDDDLAVLAGQPGIDTRIGAHDFFVAHVEATRDVGERVFLGGAGLLHHADDVGGGVDLEAMRGHGFRQAPARLAAFSASRLAAPARAVAQQRTAGKQRERRSAVARMGRSAAESFHVQSMTPHGRFRLSAFCYRSDGWFGSSSRLPAAGTGTPALTIRPRLRLPRAAPSPKRPARKWLSMSLHAASQSTGEILAAAPRSATISTSRSAINT